MIKEQARETSAAKPDRPETSPVETARQEWRTFLGAVHPDIAPIALSTDPAMAAGRYIASIDEGRASVRGNSPTDVLHGVYALLEALGYGFTVRGPVPPDAPLKQLPDVALDQTAFLRRRGIRQHINFPMDISGYPLWEAKDYIRNLARMKMTDLVFHLYESCGWFQVPMPEYVPCTRDDNPQPTFYYTERQLVPQEEGVAPLIRNRQVFCPPEAEALYGTKAMPEFQHHFLSGLIDEAQAFGMHVALSAEPHALDHIAVETFPDVPRDIELMIRTTMELVNQMVTSYPQADEYELISRENVMMPGGDPELLARQELARLLPDSPPSQVDEWIGEVREGVEAHRLPFWEPDQMFRTFPHLLQSLFVAREAFGRALAHPKLGPQLAGRDLSIGLYNGAPGLSHAMAQILHAAIPEPYGLCWIPAHGADRVNRNLERMALPPETLERLRIYSWDEVDGNMYIMQHPERNLHENIVRAGGGTASQARGLLINHWRNAENELSLSAFALFAHCGATAEDFSHEVATRLWAVDDAAAVRKLLDDLETFQDFHLNSGAGAGFSFYPCYLFSIETMAWGGGTTQTDINQALRMIEAILPQVETLHAGSQRRAGLERLRALHVFCLASRDHLQTRAAMLKMHELLAAQQTDGRERTQADHEAFQVLADKALTTADVWLRTMSRAVVDRGVEGSLVSYAHVLKRFIRKCAGLHGTAEPLADHFAPSAMDAPPLLS